NGVTPIEARCDCPDFLKNSLGLCKHVMAVLERIYERPRLLQQAQSERMKHEDVQRPGLRWDPIRPLVGLGDWLERVIWQPADQPPPRREAMASWFRKGDNALEL